MTNLTLMPGLQINIDADGLLIHLAEQTSPQAIATALISRYGAAPLLDALKEAFNGKPVERIETPAKLADPEIALQTVEIANQPKPPGHKTPPVPASLAKNCAWPSCNKEFIGYPSRQYCTRLCHKRHWNEKNPDKVKAYQASNKEKYQLQKKMAAQQHQVDSIKEDELRKHHLAVAAN